MSYVNQVGDVSRTDQVINYLKENTNVYIISLKDILLESKSEYEVYSNWGDPSHWTDRGAFISCQYVMACINEDNGNIYPVLQEDAYDILVSNQAKTINGFITKEDMLETFTIKSPTATNGDVAIMQGYSDDVRHSVWTSNSVDNDTKVLIICDSYFNSYIVDDFAESFSEVWSVHTNYTTDLDILIELYEPDIIIMECAERVDRGEYVYQFAQKLQGNDIK